jgi:hypothetical protein
VENAVLEPQKMKFTTAENFSPYLLLVFMTVSSTIVESSAIVESQRPIFQSLTNLPAKSTESTPVFSAVSFTSRTQLTAGSKPVFGGPVTFVSMAAKDTAKSTPAFDSVSDELSAESLPVFDGNSLGFADLLETSKISTPAFAAKSGNDCTFHSIYFIYLSNLLC